MAETTTDTTAGTARKASLAIIFVIVFIDLLGFGIVLPLLPRYAKRFDASDAQIGLLFASFSGMQFLFAPLWGRLSDRVGRRPVLLAGLFGSVVFYTLFGIAAMVPSLGLMFAARIGAGIAGATISTAQAYIADCTGVEGRAKGMALIGAAFGVGFTFGPILGSFAVGETPGVARMQDLNPLPGFIAAALSMIALIVAMVRLPESLKSGAQPRRHSWLNIAAIREAVRVPSVGPLLFLFFLATFAFSQFETTISRLTMETFNLDDSHNFWMFTYIGITLSIMQGVVVRRLAPVIKEERMIIIGTLLMGGGLYLVSVAAGSVSTGMLMGILPVLVGGFSFLTPSAQALISRRTDPARQGEIMGVNQSASAMARILAPMTGNQLFGHGHLLPYYVSAALLVPAFIMSMMIAGSGRDFGAPDA